ncbi:MAG: RNA polymerase sigma-70 factor [Bacteroidales bacterium]|nr:RNA polymerase sigma-70 factor [Bacteroidales bacterium]
MTDKGLHTEDRFLMESMKNGNYKAFESIFRKYYPMLCAYAHRFVDMEDVEDVVEECMVWLWEKKETVVINSTLSQYLFSMVRNKALNVLTRKGIAERAASWYFATLKQESLQNTDQYQVQELKKRIQEGISALPESYRTAFVMHRFQGMSYKEIAQKHDVSPKTIDYRIQQALKLLRKHLSDYLPVEAVIMLMAFMQDFS